MKYPKLLWVHGILIVIFGGLSAYGQTPSPTIPAWVAPEARLKAKTPFAPKPTKGNNIFTGDAETWLSDAILKSEAGYLDPISDAEINDYINKLGNYLVLYSAKPERKYVFTVIDNDDENAFCVAAGRIYIDLGMIKAVGSEDELAAVIGHEIGHDQFGHIPKTITRQFFWMTGVKKVSSAAETEKDLRDLLEAYNKSDFAAMGERLLGWARNDELQADKAGFYTMYKAGYNPEAMKTVFRHYVTEEKKNPDYKDEYVFTLLFGDHPPTSQRVTALKWESLWIKSPPKTDAFKSEAFDAVKARAAKM